MNVFGIGLPEMAMNFFKFVAEETREWMARLGVRSLGELVGRVDLLQILEGETTKQQQLDEWHHHNHAKGGAVAR